MKNYQLPTLSPKSPCFITLFLKFLVIKNLYRALLTKCVYVIIFTLFSINSYSQALNGKYTVGMGGNFPTMAKAIDSLNLVGITGKVTFQILDGTYIEQLVLDSLTYSNTIEFIGNVNDSNAVTIKFDANATNNYTFLIQNSKNISFRNIRFVALNNSYSRVLVLKASQNILFNNCVFENYCTPCNSVDQDLVTATAVYAYYDGDTIYISDNLHFKNNRFNGGYNAIRIGGCYDTTYLYPSHYIFKNSENNIFQSNIIENFANCGINFNLEATRYNTIEANQLISDSTNVTAILQNRSSVNQILRNYIK